MNITRQHTDDLNAVVTVEVSKSDYEQQVEKVLTNYRKNATIPGFRKGHVPMGHVRKQYGKAVLLEEVNKILQENLNNYLQQEKLNILGSPMPRVADSIDWDAETLAFDFDLGLTPEFDVDLAKLTDITYYNITADEEMLEEQMMRIRKQYGKMMPVETVEQDADVSGTFLHEGMGIDSPAQVNAAIFKDAATFNAFVGKKSGDVVTLKTKGLFDDDHKLMDYLKVGHDDVHGLDIDVDFRIEGISKSEPAEMDQEFFDKLFGPGNVTSADQMKARIREDSERQFATQADQKFLNDVTEGLLNSTSFSLPSEFLKRWIQTAGENPLSAEDAAAEFERSESGLRYQLIEGKVMSQYGVQINFEDLKAYTASMIRQQMAQFGQTDAEDSAVDGIVARVLSNQEEVKRLSDQVMSKKMLELFKEKVPAKMKQVSYKEFIAASYGE